MKVKIEPEAFKIEPEAFKQQHFLELTEAQGIDPVAVSSHAESLYGTASATYPPNPPYQSEQDKTKANQVADQALKICDRMKKLGFSNFDGLRDKFTSPPANAFEANQRDLIKKTMEGILYKVETAVEPTTEVLVQQYKDRNFVCADGTLTNLQAILSELSLGEQGIEAYVIDQRRNFVTQMAMDMYRNNQFEEFPPAYRMYRGMEIHNITSLVNTVAPEYGMKVKTKEEDHYLQQVYPESQAKLSKGLREALQQKATIDAFLDGIAENVKLTLPNYDKGMYKTKPKLFTQDVADTITRLKIGHIIGAEALVQMEGGVGTGYKPNLQSIIKDATTLYLHEKGVLELPEKEVELTKLRISLESSLDDNYARHAITEDVLNEAKDKGNLEYVMKYAIDNKLALDKDSLGTVDPIKYAMDNNIKIDGMDPKQYAGKIAIEEYLKANESDKGRLEIRYKEIMAMQGGAPLGEGDKTAKQYVLEGIIEQYLKTDDPVAQKNLKEQYAAVQKIGEEQAPKLLTMESNLGQFLNNPKTPEILANHKDFKGKSTLADIDYTKCDLDVIKKCKEVHEKTSKARDYDTLSTVQKVGVAFATVVPIIGNAIAYYVMKSHNKSQKAKLEATIGQSLDGVKDDLSSLSKKPKQSKASELGLSQELSQIRQSVSSYKSESRTSTVVGRKREGSVGVVDR